MKKSRLRMISAALAVCMMTSVLPLGAMAQGGGDKEAENGVSVQDVSSTPTTEEEKIAQGWVKIDKKIFRMSISGILYQRDVPVILKTLNRKLTTIMTAGSARMKLRR